MKNSSHGNRRLRRLSLAVVAVLLFVAPMTASADSLGEAKAAGWIGEQADGFLGIVDNSAPESAKALVQSVNAKRRDGYAAIAKKNGTTLAAVAVLAGERNIEKTEAGHYVKRAGEGWKKK